MLCHTQFIQIVHAAELVDCTCLTGKRSVYRTSKCTADRCLRSLVRLLCAYCTVRHPYALCNTFTAVDTHDTGKSLISGANEIRPQS
jgi:hypothetical protein